MAPRGRQLLRLDGPQHGSWSKTNIGLIECNGQSVLVYTCWDVRLTQEMLSSAGDVIARSPDQVGSAFPFPATARFFDIASGLKTVFPA
jgi:hypothetical protein